MNDGDGEIARLFRAEYGRTVAALVRFCGDIDVAEEAVQEAFAVAVARWPETGTPPNPPAWIVTTARNKALDRLRRESSRPARETAALVLDPTEQPEQEGPVRDDRLRLLFTCCHPALALNARVALTLRLLGGLTTEEIARAFLVPEPTMAQRLVRAKHKIRAARIPFRIPDEAELPARIVGVLAVLYLVFNEGYAASSGDRVVRTELSSEAIRLTRILAALMPEEPEVLGLLALMLLDEARRTSRVSADGAVVLLADQDRSLWDRALIAEGHGLVRRCLEWNQPGAYQLQAAIAAVHTDAPSVEGTDWRSIVQLYDQLLACTGSPVVALNRAVAVAELDGPQVALSAVEALDLASYHLFHAVRADLLARLDRSAEAAAAYGRAVDLAGNEVERSLLERKRAALR